MIGAAGRGDGAALAATHAAAVPAPWTAAAFEALLASGAFVLRDREGAGLVAARAAADEAEILTLAVRPEARRRGLGAALLEAALAEAVRLGAREVFLEVAVDNAPALALYRARGFGLRGRRRDYYARADGAADALVLGRALARPPADGSP